MKFYIDPIIEGRKSHLFCELILLSDKIEQFKVTGKNKTIVLQTNRLFFQAKGLKHRKGKWKLIEGQLHNEKAVEKICEAIESKIGNENKKR